MSRLLTDSQKYLLLSAVGDPALKDKLVVLLEDAAIVEGVFPNFASLPTTDVLDGSIAVTIDTNDIYVFDGNTSTWIGSTADISSLNGLTATSQTFAIGTSGTDFNINSVGSVHTYNLPNASATARGVVSIASQTFAGDKTFNNNISVGQQLLISDGTAINPSLIFGTDTNSGLYKFAADSIGIALNGANQVELFVDGYRASTAISTGQYTFSKSTSDGSLRILGGGNTSAGGLYLYGSAHASLPAHILLSNVAGDVLTITDTGRSLLGVSTYAGNGSAYQRVYGTTKLGVGFGLFAGMSTSDYSYVGYNTRSTAVVDAYEYDGADTASIIKFQNGGLDVKGTATVGSAGGAITFVNLMRISNDGRARFTDGSAASPSISFIDGNTNGFFRVGSTSFGASAGGSEVLRIASPDISVLLGDLRIETAGKGLEIAEGANAKMGVATLVGGTVTVNTTAVAANSRIFLTHQNNGGTVGFVTISARVAATSFTILSSSATDTSDIAWMIIDPV